MPLGEEELPSEADAPNQVLEVSIRVKQVQPVVCRNPDQFTVVSQIGFFQPSQRLLPLAQAHVDRGDSERRDILLSRKVIQLDQNFLSLSPFS